MIPIRKVRDLTLDARGGDERSRHIAAASALVRVRDVLYVLADDEHQMGVFDAEGDEDGYLMKVMEGGSTRDLDQNELQKNKPDFECMTLLAGFGRFHNGALLALGSGSSDERNRGTLVPLAEDGTPEGSYEIVELQELYDALRKELKDLNIEGAAVVGEDLRLMHRGNASDARNARIDLDLRAVVEALDHEEPLPASAIRGVDHYDLGRLRGVDLCFSDASPLPDGRIAFIASAETDHGDSTDKYVGSAVGVMDRDGSIVMSEPVDHDVKLEGLSARVDGERLHLLMVTDADNPSEPSPLLETYVDL